MSDYDDFAIDICHVLPPVQEFVVKWYGERCPDYDPDCIVCQHWKMVDELFRNPFEP